MTAEAIPDEMKALPHWVVWRYITREGKPTKVPFDPKRPSQNAKANDPSTWGTFQQALTAHQRKGFEGIGFQFTGSGMTGVDFDHKTFEGGIHPAAEAALSRLDTYSEMTPSGKGEHAILWGILPDWATHKKVIAPGLEVEVYSEGRFFTVTGEVIQSPFLEARQEALEALLREWGMVKATPERRGASTGLTASFRGSDTELWERIFASSSGEGIRALTDGDLTRHDGDHSRADFALCSHLAFWCNGDTARMDAMFRQTALMRDKWDERRRSDGSTYGQMTLEEVLNRWDGVGYDPSRKPSQPEVERQEWSAPEVLMRGRQQLASSGSHGNTVNSYSALWQAVVGVVSEGHTTQEGDTLTVTPYGMTELYARAGGRLMDRRQQLRYLQSQGMCGPLVRHDPENSRSAWLLTLPADPTDLPMWTARRSLQPLPLNAKPRQKHHSTPSLSVDNYYGRESNTLKSAGRFSPFWTVFALSVFGEATIAEVCDLSGASPQMARRHLRSVPTIVDRKGQRWRSVLTPLQVGELHAHITAPEVERRRRKMLEERRDFHEHKYRYLTSRGLHMRALVHFRYAEKYRRHLGEAA